MNNNPLIMQQLLQGLKNQQQAQPEQLDPRVALQNNLDNRLAFQYGTLEQQRDINQMNHPELYNLGVNLNNIHPVLGETYRDWIYNPLTNTSAPYGTFNNNVPGSIEPQYSRLLIPEGKIKEWESRLFKQGIEKLKGTPTGGAAPIQYNQMTPIQQGMQYNVASFDNPNLANSGMTPADIDKLRVMQGQDPMSFGMREILINAMRNRGYQY